MLLLHLNLGLQSNDASGIFGNIVAAHDLTCSAGEHVFKLIAWSKHDDCDGGFGAV